ncbi:MAG: ABC transporter permease [Pirellulaceae bacterium]|nr:MAG: ABC transporter permease [Pirellulaceae bacterium]GIW92029.1 MAG: ABC transporter permease [Pirellulaceae bacterium]
MVIEREILPYLEWLLFGPQGVGALFVFIFLVAIVALLAIAGSYLVASIRYGPVEGFYSVAQTIADGVPDLVRLSPRRVAAMAYLAIKESIRRKVLVAFVVFAVLLLYAGWFLDVKSDHPARLYLSFVVTATNYLVLLLALFLSTFSLPNDIKNRTIYTIVTKPVRASEIILGRTLGFVVVGSILLAAMGLFSYGFVVRNLSHQHQLDADPEEILAALERDGFWEGQTTLDRLHRHTVRIDKSQLETLGAVTTEIERGHWHTVRLVQEGQRRRFVLSGPQGDLQARVPIYGKLRFLSRSGGPGTGVNVGNEWTYRQYIEGGTLAAAIWTFDGITPEKFPDGLPLELNIRIFRTHKGDIEKGVMGTLLVKCPDRGRRIHSSTPRNFYAREFVIDRQLIPRKLEAIDSETSTVTEVDLFDLVDNGKIEVWLQCAERGQYFGMAQADVYLRAANRPFWLNFVKGYLGIWLQMVLIIAFGVAASTFLSGPIGMISTLGAVILGFSSQFVVGVMEGAIQSNPVLNPIFGTMINEERAVPGGGPIESLIRLVTQKNVMIDLDLPKAAELTVKSLDAVLMAAMMAITRMMPDFRYFHTADYLAYGYNIGGDLIAQQVTVALGYVLVLTVAGYFCLKVREVGT